MVTPFTSKNTETYSDQVVYPGSHTKGIIEVECLSHAVDYKLYLTVSHQTKFRIREFLGPKRLMSEVESEYLEWVAFSTGSFPKVIIIL